MSYRVALVSAVFAATLLVARLTFATAAEPPVQAGILNGRCTYSDGRPAPDALVQIFDLKDAARDPREPDRLPGIDLRPNNSYSSSSTVSRDLVQPVASAVTDRDGFWDIRSIPQGTSFLITAQSVSKDGFALSAAEAVLPNKWSSPRDVPLVLHIVDASVLVAPPAFSTNVSTVFYATDRKRDASLAHNASYLDEPGNGSNLS